MSNTHFEDYKRAYFVDSIPVETEEQDERNSEAVELMCSSWTAFTNAVGDSAALADFWGWQKTLPEGDQSGCDPWGGLEGDEAAS